MTRILLVGTSPTFAEHLHQATGGNFLNVRPESFPATPADLFPLLRGAPQPDVIFLEPGEGVEQALQLAEGLVRGYGSNIILVTDSEHTHGLRALRSGVRDIVSVTAPPAEIAEAVARTVALSQAAQAVQATTATNTMIQGGRGQVIAVASPKGGVGKTTVATNLAVGLAKATPQSTVLVDVDIHFGDVASALNLSPEYSLPDITQGSVSRDSMALKSLLTRHETGLFVIPGSDSPATSDAVSAEAVGTLVETLASQFQYVVVDTAPGLSEHTLAVLDHTDTLVMVTSLDVPGVRGLRKELDTLSELGMVMGMRKVVLNFYDPARGLAIADVEATIRSKVDVVVPQSKIVPLSVNQGIPLLQSEVRDPVTKALRSLVEAMLPPDSKPAPKGFLSGFQRRAKETVS